MTPRALRCGLAAVTAALGLAAVTFGAGCGTSHATRLQGDDAAVDPGEDDASTDFEAGSFGGGFTTDAATGSGEALGAGCATATAQARRQPAYLMFVLDGSDSMGQDNKWAAVVPALESIFSEMQTAADPGVGAGLIVFPDKGSPFPSPSDVPLGFVDAAQNTALDTRLGVGLSLGTPTEDALNGGYGELEAFVPETPLLAGGKKVVILITDGVPTDACSTTLGLTDDSMNACVLLAAAKLTEGTAKGGPIETFVIGVGDFPSTSPTDFDPAFLGNMAQAGGTGPAKCNPNETTSSSDLCYFEIDPSKSQTATDLQQKFETALDTIRGQVISCTFPLQSTGLGQIDPTLVNVEIDGKVVPQDATSGWTYDNSTSPTAIVLNGSACSTAKNDLMANVSVLVGCATQVTK